MTGLERLGLVPEAIRRKPLQAAKFFGILATLVLGTAGFFRIIGATAIFGDSLLADGQFLVLLLVPLFGLGLVCLVVVETMVSGYRVYRSDESIGDLIAGRPGYVLVRGAEATVALVGVTLVAIAVPPLLSASAPAAGVGIMLFLLAVGVGILFASLLRSFVELAVY